MKLKVAILATLAPVRFAHKAAGWKVAVGVIPA